jgi:hypothetical protein
MVSISTLNQKPAFHCVANQRCIVSGHHGIYRAERVLSGCSLVETEDLEKNCMAVIQAARTIKIIDLAALAPHLKTPLGYLMGSKAVYEDTQWLAEVLSHYADGIEYLSQHTGKTCIALWSDTVDGNGMLKNISVTPLIQFSLNGQSTQAILKSKLGILTL